MLRAKNRPHGKGVGVGFLSGESAMADAQGVRLNPTPEVGVLGHFPVGIGHRTGFNGGGGGGDGGLPEQQKALLPWRRRSRGLVTATLTRS